jgi:hypothetical protein
VHKALAAVIKKLLSECILTGCKPFQLYQKTVDSYHFTDWMAGVNEALEVLSGPHLPLVAPPISFIKSGTCFCRCTPKAHIKNFVRSPQYTAGGDSWPVADLQQNLRVDIFTQPHHDRFQRPRRRFTGETDMQTGSVFRPELEVFVEMPRAVRRQSSSGRYLALAVQGVRLVLGGWSGVPG